MPVPITGYEIFFVVRNPSTFSSTNDDDVIIENQAVITDAAGWTARLAITRAQSLLIPKVKDWTYKYEISYLKPDTTVQAHYDYGDFNIQYLLNKTIA